MTVQIKLELTDDEFDRLWNTAVRETYYARVDPRVRWKESEKKECIRLLIQRMVSDKLASQEKRLTTGVDMTDHQAFIEAESGHRIPQPCEDRDEQKAAASQTS